MWWRRDLPLAEPIFRHPDLDFAIIHIDRHGPIDDSSNTVAPAVAMAAVVRYALSEIADTRPFLDTELGPMHRFKDRHQTLPADFGDKYFRHMSWAHLASGAAGGGMRWPNRHPHVLTTGMRVAQRAMVTFLPLVAWQRFRRQRVEVEARGFHGFACGDGEQAVLWLLRRRAGSDGRVDQDIVTAVQPVWLALPLGYYAVTGFDTRAGTALPTEHVVAGAERLSFTAAQTAGDCAFVIRRAGG